MENETFNPDAASWESFASREEPPRKKLKRYVILSACVVVVAVAVTITVSPSATPSAAAATALRAALTSTLARNTVNISLDETVDVSNQSVNFTGGGQCDLQNDQCSESIASSNLSGSQISESVVLSGGVIYMKVLGAGATQAPTPWISMPLKGASSQQSEGLGSNPMAGLALLAKQGAAVTDEGMTSVNGENMHEYKVTISQSEEQKSILKNAADLPKWLLKSAASLPLGPISLTVDINQSGDIGRLIIGISITADGQTVSVSGTETMTSYGGPVTIVVPPANQVTPVANLGSQLGLS